jgi:tRNA(Ile)-lysidine synthetase-like protein
MITSITKPMSLESIISYWFPNEKYQEFWFDGSCDEYIKRTYSDLLIQEENGKFNNDKKNILARIILLDQFTRNIFRGSHEQYKNDNKASGLAYEILDELDKYILSQRLFALMPLRHSRDPHQLNIVMGKIREYEKEFESSSLLKKFKMATLRAYTPLKHNIKTYYRNIFTHYDKNNYYDIIDEKCKIKPVFDDNINYMKLYETVRKFFENKYPVKDERAIGISLSGGVDSMVLAYICRELQISGIINKVCAVHLEYINREESTKETNMLIEWCSDMKIPLVIRKIDHMRRDEVDREFYEEETRKMRFDLYKYVMQEHNINCFCLGHHYGDLGENVLMNIFKGRDSLNLFVMETDCIQDGVCLVRPMLSHPKSDIYEFAKVFNIPFFLDSTPDWSCRGVIRRKIMPALEDQYGSGIHTTLADFGNKSNEWGSVIETMVIRPFLEKINRSDSIISFEIDSVLINQPRIFWFRILMEIFHSIGYKMITHKNVDSILSILKKRYNSTEPLKLQFSNGLTGLFNKNILSIFIV